MACPDDPEDEADIDALREEAEAAIHTHVWGGEYGPDEVCLIVGEELFGDDEEQEEWIEAAVRRAFVAKRRAEKKWPKVTDCDRLDDVFTALEKRGIVTDYDDTAYTQSDGFEAVEELYRDEGGKESSFVGYCFYTFQDRKAALAGDGLMLAYGHFTDHANKGAEIGQIVREEFERAGFTVEWEGTLNRRIFLKGFRWQRRSPK